MLSDTPPAVISVFSIRKLPLPLSLRGSTLMAGRNLGGSNRYPHFRGTALIQYSTTQKRSDFRTLCYFILNGSFLSRVFTWRLRKSHHGPQIAQMTSLTVIIIGIIVFIYLQVKGSYDTHLYGGDGEGASRGCVKITTTESSK